MSAEEKLDYCSCRVSRWELIPVMGAQDALPLGNRSAFDKKTNTSEGMCGLDGPFKPTREDPRLVSQLTGQLVYDT